MENREAGEIKRGRRGSDMEKKREEEGESYFLWEDMLEARSQKINT